MPRDSKAMVRPAEYDPLDLQGQMTARNEASEANRLQRRNELEDLRWFMSDKRGRRFMYRVLAESGIFRSSFTGTDAQTNFREGERNVGLRFLHDVMEACPDRFNTMLQEQREDDDPERTRKPSKRRK